jgi:3-oxoacyl-[acyl-carrier protein] reductase
MPDGSLNGKIAIVTGAGQGIGKHAAKTLAEAGAAVAVADLNAETAEATAAELDAISKAIPVVVDVRDGDAVKSAMAQAASKLGGIDIAVCNAGIVPHFRWGLPHWPRVADMDEEFWDRVIRTNLYGTFFAAKHAIPHMRARGGGHIVTLYGGGGLGALAYMTTKDSIRTFTRYLSEEVEGDNICAVTFSPRLPIATETAPDEAKDRMPGPDVLGQAFVLCAELPMEETGKCLAIEDGKLVEEESRAG